MQWSGVGGVLRVFKDEMGLEGLGGAKDVADLWRKCILLVIQRC